MVRFPLFRKTLVTALLFSIGLPISAHAQDEAPVGDDSPAVEPSAVESEEGAVVESSSAEDDRDQLIAKQQKEIDALRSDMEALKERVDENEFSAEEENLEALQLETSQFESTLDIYGFIVVDASRVFMDEKSPLSGRMVNSFTFGVSDLNIYLSGQVTETVSTLVELGFSFLPHGAETDMLNYTRIDNRIQDPQKNRVITFGGVEIVRAHFDWQPADFFGVTAGRFLTPFGIWNIDHGAPVVIPNRLPYLLVRQAIPDAQTGIMVHGRFFPGTGTHIDYAITAANGRGPTEETYDLDDNKALGLRLRFQYEGDNWDIALGGYGFWGKMTDQTKELNLVTYGFDRIVTEQYWELDGALDFLLNIHGVRLQAEYVRGLVTFEERPFRMIPEMNVPMPDGSYQPDYIKWDMYALLAWELPLDAILGEMRLTPYFMYEYSVMDDTDPDVDLYMLSFGLNFKPNSYVTTKLHSSVLKFPHSSLDLGDVWIVSGQVAVAF